MNDNEKSFFSVKMLQRLFYTVRYLKWQQVYYRFYYPFKQIIFIPKKAKKNHIEHARQFPSLEFPAFSIDNHLYSYKLNDFVFLNKCKSFGQKIEWEFAEYGLLWSFHLHYFDWLNDKNTDPFYRLETIKDYVKNKSNRYLFIHSYPASLRIVNWVKFLIENKIQDEEILNDLYQQAYRLSHFPEYELMGNHLLENGIALVWAGYFFDDKNFIKLGEQIVGSQLKEQILEDGAHFEKSTSYHSLILKNLLVLYSFSKTTTLNSIFINLLIHNCSAMLSHLNVLTEIGGDAPQFGDSNRQMTVSFNELKNVAQNLMLKCSDIRLSKSGFRKFDGYNYQIFFNNGFIAASYQPGHSHADAFTFCLNVEQKPIIVNRGISTYERSKLRLNERGTTSHNTICIEEENISDVWAAFRMGKRAKIKALIDSDELISFQHDGYFSKYKITHQRLINKSDFEINIIDLLLGWKGQLVKIYFHFHPDIVISKVGNDWNIEGTNISLSINGADTHLESYNYCHGFNDVQVGQRIVGRIIDKNVSTTIKTNNGKTN